MAVCLLNKGILKADSCGYSLKQITRLFLANYAEVTGTTLGDKGNTVAEIAMKGESKWYEIEFNKDSASFEDTLQVGDAGAKYRQSSITFSYGGQWNGDAVDALDALSLGRFMAAAMLSDGSWVLFGRLTPLEANAAQFSAAAEATGFSGTQATLQNNTVESPLPLEEKAVSVILGE